MSEQKQPTPPGRFFLKAFALALLFVLLVAGGFGWSFYKFATSPMQVPNKDIELVIMPDTSFDGITRQIAEMGLIRDERRFKLLAMWKDQARKVRSGRFLVQSEWTPMMLLDALVSGLPLLERITFPEGLTWWETGKRLEAAGFVRFEDFKSVVHDPDFLRKYGIPLSSAEGYLFPDTYLFMRPLELNTKTAQQIVGRMVDTFWSRTEALWEGERVPGPRERSRVAQIVILASIIERESGVAFERPIIAGVFQNRLRRKMPLQADPTIIYGLGPDFDGKIRRKNIDDKANPYNTYQISGLPPGPICSPGLGAIKASNQPANHNYLYFVARGDGTHEFSTNLADHNRAVRMFILDKSSDTP